MSREIYKVLIYIIEETQRERYEIRKNNKN